MNGMTNAQVALLAAAETETRYANEGRRPFVQPYSVSSRFAMFKRLLDDADALDDAARAEIERATLTERVERIEKLLDPDAEVLS